MRPIVPFVWIGRAFQSLRLSRHAAGHADPSDVPTPEERQNARLLVQEAPFSNLALTTVVSFFALFAIQLGASNAMVGWLTSGPALVNLIWPIPSARLIQRLGNHPRSLAFSALVQRLLLISMAAIPFLPPSWRPAGTVLLVTLSAFPNTVWGNAFQVACAEMFHPRHLARIIGERWAVMSIVNILATLFLGWFIDSLKFPANFQWAFAGLGILSLASVPIVLRLRMPQADGEEAQEEPPAAEKGEKADAPARLTPALFFSSYRPFVLYEIGILVAYLAYFAALPLFRIYWVRDLGAAGTWMGVLTSAFSLGGLVGYIFWGRWSRPERERRLMLITGLGVMGFYPMVAALFPYLAPQILIIALGGFFSGGTELIVFNRTVQLSPRRLRPTFSAVHQIAVNAAGFLGPLVSTALASHFGVRPVLAGTGLVGIAGALLIYWLGWYGEAPMPGLRKRH